MARSFIRTFVSISLAITAVIRIFEAASLSVKLALEFYCPLLFIFDFVIDCIFERVIRYIRLINGREAERMAYPLQKRFVIAFSTIGPAIASIGCRHLQLPDTFSLLQCILILHISQMTLRCLCSVVVSGIPDSPFGLRLALVALDYSCEDLKTSKVNQGAELWHKVEISLIEDGVDTEKPQSKKRKPIARFPLLFLYYFAIVMGYSEVKIAAQNDNGAEVWLQGDSPLRSRNLRAFTALLVHLYFTVFFAHASTIKVTFSFKYGHLCSRLDFLEKDEYIDVKKGKEGTALHGAVTRQSGNDVQYLLDKGADRTIQNEDGFTPYQTALRLGVIETIRPFLASNQRNTLQKAAVASLAVLEGDLRVLESVLSHARDPEELQAMLEYKDEQGNTALHCAAQERNPEVLERLLRDARHTERTNKEGKSPLDIAAEERRDANRVTHLLAENSGMVLNRESEVFVPQYPKKSKPRGICLVINNIKFEDGNFGDREGAENDHQMTKALFEKLGFKVVVKQNLTKIEMELVFRSWSSHDHGDHDMFVCVISSHGGSGDEIYGTDGRALRVKDILEEFNPTRCPSLNGKPKVFVIQACRGNMMPADTVPQAGFDNNPDEETLPDACLGNSTIPSEADFLVVFSTVPGQKAFRHKTQGSLFLTLFVDVVEKFHENCDLLKMLTLLNCRMAKVLEIKQISCPVHTLRRDIYL